MVRLLALVCWLGLLVGHAVAQYDQFEHIVDRAVLVDPSGAMTIDEVERGSFAPVGAVLSGGYSDAAHWLRLVVRSPADGGDLLLRVRPTYLDALKLFARDAEGNWNASHSGDRVPFLDRSVPGVPHAFVVTPTEPLTTYYLRLSTTSSSLLHATAMPMQYAGLSEMWINIVHMIAFSIMAGILIWAASDLIVTRDPILGWFTFAQALQLVYFIAITGNLAPIAAVFGPVDDLTSLLVCLVPLTTLIFHRVLIRPFAPGRVTRRLFDLLVLIDAVALAALLAGWTRFGLQLNALVILLSAPAFVLLAWTAREEGPTGRVPLRIVYTLQAIVLASTMLPLLGLAGGVEWVMHGTLIPGLVSAVLMFVLLNRRGRTLARQAFDTRLKLGLARQQLAMERQQREVQGQFLAMLSHELKTPITVARLALGTAGASGEPRRMIETALENMNDIIDRCTYADQVEQHQLPLLTETCHVADVIAETIGTTRQPQRIAAEVGELPPFVTDRLLLGIVLSNLLDNALKYGAKDVPVRLKAELRDREGVRGLFIGVENRPGRVGLPDPERVFDKFYRGSGAGRSSGAGLGLYIVQSVATRLGASIRYATDAETVRFEVWLPC